MNDPVVPLVKPDELDPPVRAMLEGIGQAIGFVPNSMLTYFHRPAIAGAVMDLTGAILRDPASTLPLALKFKLGVICSAINGCTYCASHQCHAASHPAGGIGGLSEEQLRALANGSDEGGDAVERACFAYARNASFDPSSVTVDKLAEVAAVLTPAQMVELAAVVGMWKMINTIHDTLHLPVEDGMGGGAELVALARVG